MKIYVIMLLVFSNLIIGCSKNNFIKKEEFSQVSLNAQQNEYTNSNVRTILKTSNNVTISLDGKNYKQDQFKSIIDTISGDYKLDKINSDTVKITRSKL